MARSPDPEMWFFPGEFLSKNSGNWRYESVENKNHRTLKNCRDEKNHENWVLVVAWITYLPPQINLSSRPVRRRGGTFRPPNLWQTRHLPYMIMTVLSHIAHGRTRSRCIVIIITTQSLAPKQIKLPKTDRLCAFLDHEGLFYWRVTTTTTTLTAPI